MKYYKPEIKYDDLPSTGQQLMFICADDFRQQPSFRALEDEDVNETTTSTTSPSCQTEKITSDEDVQSAQEADQSEEASSVDSDCPSNLLYGRYDDTEDEDWQYGGSSADDEDSRLDSDQSSREGSSHRYAVATDSPNRSGGTGQCNDPASTSTSVRTKKKSFRKRRTLPIALVFPDKGGKLMYFGLEQAILGDSPGVMFKNADLIQYMNVYAEDPGYLPKTLRKKVIRLLKSLPEAWPGSQHGASRHRRKYPPFRGRHEYRWRSTIQQHGES